MMDQLLEDLERAPFAHRCAERNLDRQQGWSEVKGLYQMHNLRSIRFDIFHQCDQMLRRLKLYDQP